MNSLRLPLLILTIGIATFAGEFHSSGVEAPPDKKTETKADADQTRVKASARRFIERLANEEFETAAGEFDATMRKAMPATTLRTTWQDLTRKIGKLSKQGDPRVQKVGQYRVADVACTFEKATLDVRVSFDRDNRIAGLFFRPPQTAINPSPEDAGSRIALETKTGTLHGTLDLPSGPGPFPAVVIIAGSGPTDRDGNQPALKNDSLKLLGHGLRAHGIAALRFDKRMIAASAIVGLHEEDLRFETYAADAAEWVKLLRKDRRFSRIGVIGHSEGSLIGMLAATQTKADVFVSIAGAGRLASELLREQLAKNVQSPEIKLQWNKIIDALVAGRTIDDVPESLAVLFRPSVQPYLISWFKYDPAEEIAKIHAPVMIVQGTTDIQVTIKDAQRLAHARKDARLDLIPGMNHVLKSAATSAEQTAAYTDPSLPLAPKLVDDISAFLKESLVSP